MFHVGALANVYICGGQNGNYCSVLQGWKNKMAFDLNTTIGPIIDGVVTLMPSFLNLIVAVVPIIITVSVVSFIIKFWDGIVGMLKF